MIRLQICGGVWGCGGGDGESPWCPRPVGWGGSFGPGFFREVFLKKRMQQLSFSEMFLFYFLLSHVIFYQTFYKSHSSGRLNVVFTTWGSILYKLEKEGPQAVVKGMGSVVSFQSHMTLEPEGNGKRALPWHAFIRNLRFRFLVTLKYLKKDWKLQCRSVKNNF